MRMIARSVHVASVRLAVAAGLLACAAVAGGASGMEEPSALAQRLLSDPAVRRGLCVHVGCGNGALTAELARHGVLAVHGLSADRTEVAKARRHIRAQGTYGPVAADYCDMKRLPYAENMVNVLVAAGFPSLERRGLTLEEVVRVLAPGGVAWIESAGRWERTVKPRPAEMDDWGQVRHNPSRTSVSNDELVGPPTSVRWISGDRWVSISAGMHGIYSGGGRTFAIYPTQAENVRLLVARDAYNGLKLWEKRVEVAGRMHRPPIAAVGDRLYTALKPRDSLVALDAATGSVAMTYAFPATMITYHDGVLIPGQGAHTAWDAATGRKLWEAKSGTYDPCIIGDGRIFAMVYGQKELICLDLKTGKEIWRTPALDKARPLCYCDGILFAKAQLPRPEGAGGHAPIPVVNHAYSGRDGRHLWSHHYGVHWHQGRADVFFLGGAVWVQDDGPPQAWVALDPETGSVKKRVNIIGKRGFLRCYPDRATGKYILEDVGVGCFDFRQEKFHAFYGGRGTCGAGYTPANGLIYRSPDICVCFAQVRGDVALAPGAMPDLEELIAKAGPALEKGPAFGAATAAQAEGDWPTYRHDPRRTGATTASVGPQLKPLWQAEIGRNLTSPVVAGGKVFAAAADEHRVVAFDAANGTPLWDFAASGRVDTPPTIHGGLALFGSADGWLYCLRAADGELAWRLRAAPEDRRIVVRGQLESLWPVHGSVLLQNGTALFAAGRHSEVDGGILLYAAEPATGKVIWRRCVIREKLLQQQHIQDIFNTANGVLATDGASIYMDRARFDPATGKDAESAAAQLRMYGGACDFTEDIARPPYSWKHEWRRWAYTSHTVHGKALPPGDVAAGNALATDGKIVVGLANLTAEVFARTIVSRNTATPLWTVKLPDGLTAKGIILSGEVVLVGAASAPEGKPTGIVLALDAATGAKLGELALDAAPRFDGMAATAGRLFISTQTGRLICLAGE